MSTEFYLLRHASHAQLGSVLTGRRPGVPLSQAGREEAQALARRLSLLKLDAVYTSPRLRALETARIVAERGRLACAVARELDEIDFGRWSGMGFEALSRDPTWRRWNEERDAAATPAGETMDDVATRFCALVGRLAGAHAGGAAALVSHADVIKAGLCRFLGWPFARVHDFDIEPASITVLKIDGGDAWVETADLRAGFPEAGAAA